MCVASVPHWILPSSLHSSLTLSPSPSSLPLSPSITCSYQRDILALLAEQLMMKWEGSPGEEEIATPTLVQPPPLLAIAPPTSIAKDSCKATAVLNRFMTLDLKLLERESR